MLAGGAVGVGGGLVGDVKQFCYLGDVFDCGGAEIENKGKSWGSMEKVKYQAFC